MIRPWEIQRRRAGYRPSLRTAPKGTPADLGEHRKKSGLELAAQAATVIAALVSAVSLYVAAKAIDFQRLQGEFDTARHQMESAKRSAKVEALRARQLQADGDRAAADLQDMKDRERHANAELLMVEGDLQRRNVEVADARLALDRLNKQQGVTAIQRTAAVRQLAKSELGAFVVAHLSLLHEFAARDRSKLLMLADANDAAFPEELLNFSVYSGEPDRPAPVACRLSQQYFLALEDEESDPRGHTVAAGLCDYLRQDTGAVSLGSFVRARGQASSTIQTMQVWQFLASDAPFSLTIMKATADYEAR